MSQRLLLLGIIVFLLLSLCACNPSPTEPASKMDGLNNFNLSLTLDQFTSTYTRFVGTLVQKVSLDDGEYCFNFEGDPQHFALKDKRGVNLIELKPSDQATLVVKRGNYYLCVTNKSEGVGAFTVKWHK